MSNVTPINAGSEKVQDPSLKAESKYKSRGEQIYNEMNESLKGLFGNLLALVTPPKGQKMDAAVQGLVIEVNVKLREAMYRVTDIATLVDRQDKHGERVTEGAARG